MTEAVKQYISWKVVASSIGVITITLLSLFLSTGVDRLRVLDQKLDTKVEVKRYEVDTQRIETKLDQLINMHINDRRNR